MVENVVADPVNSSKELPSWFQVARDRAKGNLLVAALLLTIIAPLIYFFGFVKIFRTLQARLALNSLPCVAGIVLGVWEKNVARILLFPIQWRT